MTAPVLTGVLVSGDGLAAGGPRISREEVFGPVVCVYGVGSPEEAVVRANALPFAFQASVFAHSWGA